MNLQKLFETQAKLDEHIYDNHPELRGQDNLDWKILALQVELGECANEWRGFKKWSNDQEPRIELFTWIDGLGECVESPYDPRMLVENGQFNAFRIKNPLLEEYVDCLHFILSIGLELEVTTESVEEYLHEYNINVYSNENKVASFSETFHSISELSVRENEECYEEVFLYFAGLGKSLGFNWEQVEQAYFAKNQINHERQESGY